MGIAQLKQGVFSGRNEFIGVNVILQSRLQIEGGWSVFHGQHIYKIAEALNRTLPADYYATTEDALRIHEGRIEPDDLILRSKNKMMAVAMPNAAFPFGPQPAQSTSAQKYLDVLDLPEDERATAVLIHKRTSDGNELVTRVELLSPTNVSPLGKGDAPYLYKGVLAYDRKRAETLAAGVNLIEIHYLDRHPPTTGLRKYIPTYPALNQADRDPAARPFHVAVTVPLTVEPRPLREDEGDGGYQMQIAVSMYPFAIEEAIPTIAVPLALNDPPLNLDLQAVYDSQFFDQRWGIGVDYYTTAAQTGLELHAPADQEAFAARILSVLDAVERDTISDLSQKIPLIRNTAQLHAIAARFGLTI